MKNYRNLCAQAAACAVLSSSVIGMEDHIPMLDFAHIDNPFILQAPLGGHAAVAPSTPPRKPAPLHMDSPSKKIPDREWVYDGTRVITCDIEADPRLGGSMTEIALIELQYGEYTGKSLHYYFNPSTKVDYRFVKKVNPIDQSKQPTFEQVADELYNFIKGATLVTYGSFDVRKLVEHFGALKPYGRIFEFESRDALQMEKRDFARKKGKLIFSPEPKKTRVVTQSPSKLRKEYQAKRKASRDKKEIADLNKLTKDVAAHRAGHVLPKRKKPDSIFTGVSFSQGDVAARRDITPSIAMVSVGTTADNLNQQHDIPQQHVGEAHHAMHDTQVLTGILKMQSEPTLRRRIVRANVERTQKSRDLSPQRRTNKENQDDNMEFELLSETDDDKDSKDKHNRKKRVFRGSVNASMDADS